MQEIKTYERWLIIVFSNFNMLRITQDPVKTADSNLAGWELEGEILHF